MTAIAPTQTLAGPSQFQAAIKRAFDIAFALLGLTIFGWFLYFVVGWARRDTGGSGIFRQSRIGRHGRIFQIYKIRTMRQTPGQCTTITTARDPRITPLGAMLRRWKIDELPQLVNVLRGDMSLVGPRPEVPQYLEQIRRLAPTVLLVRPGVTGPASIVYRNEELLLAAQNDPVGYNDRVIFPDKLRINQAYVANYSFLADMKYLWATFFSFLDNADSNRIPITDPIGRTAA